MIVLGTRLLRSGRVDAGMAEIGQGLVPDPKFVDQSAETAIPIALPQPHGHRHR
jgi:hypothetical protein